MNKKLLMNAYPDVGIKIYAYQSGDHGMWEAQARFLTPAPTGKFLMQEHLTPVCSSHSKARAIAYALTEAALWIEKNVDAL